MRLKPHEIKNGTVFYESAYGVDIRFTATSDPRKDEIYLAHETCPRTQWSWEAVNQETGEVTSFLVTEGLEHYGPKIYSKPAYYHSVR